MSGIVRGLATVQPRHCRLRKRLWRRWWLDIKRRALILLLGGRRFHVLGFSRRRGLLLTFPSVPRLLQLALFLGRLLARLLGARHVSTRCFGGGTRCCQCSCLCLVCSWRDTPVSASGETARQAERGHTSLGLAERLSGGRCFLARQAFWDGWQRLQLQLFCGSYDCGSLGH